LFPLNVSYFHIAIFLIAIIGSIPLKERIVSAVDQTSYKVAVFIMPLFHLALLFFITMELLSSTFSPFIYFRF
jgi:hypothetical protein